MFSNNLRKELNNVCRGRSCSSCPFNIISLCGQISVKEPTEYIYVGEYKNGMYCHDGGKLILASDFIKYLYENIRKCDFYFMKDFFNCAVKEGELFFSIKII